MPNLPIDPSTVAIAGVPILLLIIGLIEAAKRAFPRASGNIWFGVSLLLGVILFSLAHIADHGVPTTLAAGLNLVVIGLAFGLATSKFYDETLGKGRQDERAFDIALPELEFAIEGTDLREEITQAVQEGIKTWLVPQDDVDRAEWEAIYHRQQERAMRAREAAEQRLAEVMAAHEPRSGSTEIIQ